MDDVIIRDRDDYVYFLKVDSDRRRTVLSEIDLYLSLDEEQRKKHYFSPIVLYLLTGKKQDGFIQDKLISRQVMETSFNVFNHNDEILIEENPLHEIQLNPINTSLSSNIEFYIEKFHECEIYKTFGISLEAFFNLPPDVCRTLFRIREKAIQKENTNNGAILKETEKALKDVKNISKNKT